MGREEALHCKKGLRFSRPQPGEFGQWHPFFTVYFNRPTLFYSSFWTDIRRRHCQLFPPSRIFAAWSLETLCHLWFPAVGGESFHPFWEAVWGSSWNPVPTVGIHQLITSSLHQTYNSAQLFCRGIQSSLCDKGTITWEFLWSKLTLKIEVYILLEGSIIRGLGLFTN